MKAREVKRAKLVAKYAEKRQALKEAGDWAALDKLPKNSSPVRLHNRCSLTELPHVAFRTAGEGATVVKADVRGVLGELVEGCPVAGLFQSLSLFGIFSN